MKSKRALCIALTALCVSFLSNGAFGQDGPSLKEFDEGFGLVFPEGPDIMWPALDPRCGRRLFGSKGCVVCHSVNRVGGQVGPALDAAQMPPFANPLEFAARMFRGASTMIELQKRDLGYQIDLTGQELADIVGFVHNQTEQRRFSEDDIPADIQRLMPYHKL